MINSVLLMLLFFEDSVSNTRKSFHSEGIVLRRELNQGDTVKLLMRNQIYLVAMNQPDYVYDDFAFVRYGVTLVGLSRSTGNYRLFVLEKGSNKFKPLSEHAIDSSHGGIDYHEDAWEMPAQGENAVSGVIFRGNDPKERFVYRISTEGFRIGAWQAAARVIVRDRQLLVEDIEGTFRPLESRQIVNGKWIDPQLDSSVPPGYPGHPEHSGTKPSYHEFPRGAIGE